MMMMMMMMMMWVSSSSGADLAPALGDVVVFGG